MKKYLNIPNILTILRVISVPFFVAFLLHESQLSRFIAFVLFALASITDLVDGYLARKWNQETELGKFLDPLADKSLVIGALITFLFLSVQVTVWMVFCIIGRDFLITILRFVAKSRGKSLRTSMFGKIKTTFQMFAISVVLISLFLVTYKQNEAINEQYRQAAAQEIQPWTVAGQNLDAYLKGETESTVYALASFLPFYLMLLTTIFTIISGLRYLVTNYRLFWPPPWVVEQETGNGEG